jgi:hypothetical protein
MLPQTVCLRFRKFLFFAPRIRTISPAQYARRTLAICARGACAAIFHSCTPTLRARSPALLFFYLFLCEYAMRAARYTRTSYSRHVPFMYSLRFRNFFPFFAPRSTICALHAAHSRIAPPCSIHVLAHFALVLPPRACAVAINR